MLFTPFFILILPLISGFHISPLTAIYVGLIIELCGFGSAFVGYYRLGLIDFVLARRLLFVLAPSAVAASALAHRVPEHALLALLGVIMLILAVLLGRSLSRRPPLPKPASAAANPNPGERVLVDALGYTYTYPAMHSVLDYLLSAIGGVFVGLVGVGVGEIKTTYFIIGKRMPPRIAVGTGVFIVLVTVTAAIGTRIALSAARVSTVSLPWNILIMAVPAVLLGGQIAARLSRHINADTLKRVLVGIFTIVGLILISRGVFSL